MSKKSRDVRVSCSVDRAYQLAQLALARTGRAVAAQNDSLRRILGKKPANALERVESLGLSRFSRDEVILIDVREAEGNTDEQALIHVSFELATVLFDAFGRCDKYLNHFEEAMHALVADSKASEASSTTT